MLYLFGLNESLENIIKFSIPSQKQGKQQQPLNYLNLEAIDPSLALLLELLDEKTAPLKLSQTYRKQEILEGFVSNLAKQLTSYDECRYHHYLDHNKIYDPMNFAKSALTSNLCALDEVVQSIVIVTEIFLFRKKIATHHRLHPDHPESIAMLAQLKESLESVWALPNLNMLVTPRVFQILYRCESKLDLQDCFSLAVS